MSARPAQLTRPADGYETYLAEGASLLSRICDGAHLAHVAGRLVLVAEVTALLADALGNWGADLSELEPEEEL